jgi:serine/threonine protein kinase
MPSNGKLWQDLRTGASFSLAPEAPTRSPELEELVRQMMERNPAKRITIDEILKHPIVKSIHRRRSYVEEEGLKLKENIVKIWF